METVMDFVGARELKQHTGAVIARVQSGERLVLTVRGRPVAIIAPIKQQALDEALAGEAARVENEGWLAAAAGAFAFWDSTDDAVWDDVAVE
jgi:prevent-host-death family protein